MNAMRALQVTSLSKSYRRRTVLDALTIDVGQGEALAVIGPNGAGKSTFLGCLTGERLPDSGSIRICGADPFSTPRDAAQCLGFVPEQPFLYGELTVSETLRFVAAVRGLDPSESETETTRLLELLALTGSEGTLCRELSQGMGRKVAITAALIHRPRLIVLDEAFNGLDQRSSERLLTELEIRKRNGAAILLSSHDLSLLAERCDRGLLLAPGRWSIVEGEDWERWKVAPRLIAI